MAIKIQSTKDIKIDSVKCIVYGGPGSGKTRMVATAPNPIIISAEKGLLSLADVDASYIEVRNMKDFNDAYKWAKSSTEADLFESIGLDSLSEIAEVLVTELKPQFKDGRQVYMALADAMMPMLRKFRDLERKHTLFTVKMLRVQDEESGAVTEELLMPGKVLGNQIPYMVDEMFKINVDRKGTATLQTAPSRLSFAKDRSGALANPEALDMTAIIKKIMAKQGN